MGIWVRDRQRQGLRLQHKTCLSHHQIQRDNADTPNSTTHRSIRSQNCACSAPADFEPDKQRYTISTEALMTAKKTGSSSTPSRRPYLHECDEMIMRERQGEAVCVYFKYFMTKFPTLQPSSRPVRGSADDGGTCRHLSRQASIFQPSWVLKLIEKNISHSISSCPLLEGKSTQSSLK